MTTTAQGFETGCVLGGHRGRFIVSDMIFQVAVPAGFPMTDEDVVIVAAYEHDEESLNLTDGPVDVVDATMEIAVEALQWLNDNAPEGLVWHWWDGELYLSTTADFAASWD